MPCKDCSVSTITLKSKTGVLANGQDTMTLNYPLDFPEGIVVGDYVNDLRAYPLEVEFEGKKRVAHNDGELSRIEDEWLNSL